jgi:quercetin dioxygenase-like cupin family protein
MNYVQHVLKGKIFSETHGKDIDAIAWNPHAKFKGVALKHLVTGETTQGKFSCHLVKVQAGHEIGDHIHESQWELHEVLEGNGKGILLQQEMNYVPGAFAVIPQGKVHKIIAGNTDMYLFAKFVPALL